MEMMNEADNARRSFGLAQRTAAAGLALADHLRAFLASGDAVAIALKYLLGDPADDGRRVFGTVELLGEFRFEVCDVRHRSFCVGC
jgi:hypothetical protein